MDIQENMNTKLSAIDKALAAAKARKAAKDGLSTDSTAEVTKAPKVKVDDAARAAARMAKDAERQAKKEQRDAARTAKREARAAEKASRQPAHMKKIERAASKLPGMDAQMQLLFNEATANFGASQITALALHLQHFNRVKATERALSQKLETGMDVRIIGGNPKFVGLTGKTGKIRRIRCFVEVPGQTKPVYLFTSDVEVISAAAKTGTNG